MIPEKEYNRLKVALEYMAEESNWLDDGTLKRPGGYQKRGIILYSHNIEPCTFAKMALLAD